MLSIKRLFSQDFLLEYTNNKILLQINAFSALLKEKGEEALMMLVFKP